MAEISYLSHARYGKDKVRVLRVVREGTWHNIVEYNVTALVEGDIETRSVMFLLMTRGKCSISVSYTKADNSVVVATDSSAYFFFAPLHNPFH